MADEQRTYTQEEMDALVQERLAAAKAEGDEAFKNLWEEAKQAKAKVKALDGVDIDEYRSMRTKIAELEQQQKAEKAGITSEQLTKMRQEVEADLVSRFAKMGPEDLAKRIPTVADVLNDNRALRLDSVVKAEMAKAGARAERIDALFKLSADQFELTDDGKPMVRGKPGVEIATFVGDDLRAEYPELYNGSGSSGGGASKSNAGGGGQSKVIAADDSDGFMANLEGIAGGTVEVR